MTEPSFFKATFNRLIQQESLKRYQGQVAEKKACLNGAHASYEKALQSVEAFKSAVSVVVEKIEEINQQIASSEEELVIQKLQAQKKPYEQCIERAKEQFAAYEGRIDQLLTAINTLENQIKNLEDLDIGQRQG